MSFTPSLMPRWLAGIEGLSPRARAWLCAALAALVAAPSLLGEFVLDDEVAIVRSVCIQGPFNLAEILSSDFWCSPAGSVPVDSWRPLPVLLWWTLWRIGGGGPLLFKLAGLVAHAACAAQIVYLVDALGLPRRVSLVSGALFACLAIHMDAVASAVGLAEPLSVLAILLTLRLSAPAMMSASTWQGRGADNGTTDDSITASSNSSSKSGGGPPEATALHPLALLGVATATSLAIASKESGAITPALVIALGVLGSAAWRSPTWRSSALRLAVTSSTVCGAMLGARHLALGQTSSEHLTATVNPLLGAEVSTRLLTAIDLIGRYLLIACVGSPLSADYSYNAVPLTSIESPGTLLSVSFALGLLLVLGAALALRRLPPGPVRALVGLLALSLLLPSQLVVLLPAIFAERLFYLPSVFFCVLMGVAIHRVPELIRPSLARWFALSVAGWIAAQGVLASAHAWAWGSSDRITAVTVESTPQSARAQLWRARVALRLGDPESTIEHAERALDILPDWAEALAVRGIARDLQGDPKGALLDLRAAFELTPSEGEVTDLFIQFLLRYGHVPQAQLVFAQHSNVRGGQPDPQVTRPPT